VVDGKKRKKKRGKRGPKGDIIFIQIPPLAPQPPSFAPASSTNPYKSPVLCGWCGKHGHTNGFFCFFFPLQMEGVNTIFHKFSFDLCSQGRLFEQF
jgi:hypothetical protein